MAALGQVTCSCGRCPKCKNREYMRRHNRTEQGIKNKRISGYRRRGINITLERYDELYEEQDGVCAICKQPETTTSYGAIRMLSVDHDHVTGEVRGILCASCNRAIGQLGDSAERLRSAAAYLERWM